MAVDPAILTLVGTLCGGIGIKVLDGMFSRKKSKFDDASRLRDELRIQITDQNTQITKLEAERDKYRDELFDLRDKYRELQTQLTLTLHGIKEQIANATNENTTE